MDKALALAGAKVIHAVDVYSREHNNIDSHMGNYIKQLNYIHLEDQGLSAVPDLTCDFAFSFGCFVHLSPSVQEFYIEQFAQKLRHGAIGFVQIADHKQWNYVVSNPDFRIDHILQSRLDESLKTHKVWEQISKHESIAPREQLSENASDLTTLIPGRYFYIGIEAFCNLLESKGLQVEDPNYISSLRDPIVMFRKP